MYLINKWIWRKSENINSENLNSQLLKNVENFSDEEKNDSKSILFDNDYIESRYGTPLSTITEQHGTDKSNFKNPSISSIDSFFESVETFPQISHYFMPILNGPIFPEINEIFINHQRSVSTSFSFKNSVDESDFEENHFFHSKILKNSDEKIVPLTM